MKVAESFLRHLSGVVLMIMSAMWETLASQNPFLQMTMHQKGLSKAQSLI